MSHAIKLPLAFVGHTIAEPVGRVVIALTFIRDGVYRVTINHPGRTGLLGAEVDGCSYPTEAEARSEARRMFRAYASGQSVEQVAERREELADLIENWVKRPGPDALLRVRRWQSEADLLQPPHRAAQNRALAAEIAATMTAAYADAVA
jgi:hypothetical protein